MSRSHRSKHSIIDFIQATPDQGYICQDVTTLHRAAPKDLNTKSELTGYSKNMAEMTVLRSP